MLTQQSTLWWKPSYFSQQVNQMFMKIGKDNLTLCLFFRCSWFKWCPNHRTNARKVSMCIGRILPVAISESANSFWQTPSEITFAKNSLIVCDRAVVFCSFSWQDSYWDPYPGYDYVRTLISVALQLNDIYVTCNFSVYTYSTYCTSTSTSSTHLCTYVGVSCTYIGVSSTYIGGRLMLSRCINQYLHLQTHLCTFVGAIRGLI